MKKLIDIEFEVPAHLKSGDITKIEAYSLIIYEGRVFIQGTQLVDYTEMPITVACVLPLTYKKTKELLPPPPFLFEKDKVVFQVSYENFAWYFYEYGNALTLLNILLKVKAIGLGWNPEEINVTKDNYETIY